MDYAALAFLDTSRRLLTRHYLPKIRISLDALSDADVWWRPNDSSNSIGNLLLHVSGNARQWIISGVGGAADTRDRAREFAERKQVSKGDLLALFTGTIDDVDAILARLTGAQLSDQRTIQGREVTVFDAIYHVVEHVAMHTGQIILLAKIRAPGAIKFYEDAGGKARPIWPEAQVDIGQGSQQG